MSAEPSASAGGSSGEFASGLVEGLAGRIGPRRPGSIGEVQAAELVRNALAVAGLDVRVEDFRGPSSFAWSQAVAPALSLAGARKTALLLGAIESDLRLEPLSRLFSRQASQNVVAEIPAAGQERRTLAVVSHLDSSRSGLLFHPEVAPQLRRLSALVSAAVAWRALSPHPRGRLARWADGAFAAALTAGLVLLAEREICGRDVPGANDNASGVAVAAAFARELAAKPLESTRVVFLATGCEESGTVGMRAFLDAHRGEWEDWLFLNLDGVGAPATLRFLPREGMTRIFSADPALIHVFEETARDHPELGLRAATDLAGLTYDATQVLARGGRAITLSAQDRTIPNYHSAQDVPENLDGDVLARALDATRLVAGAIDEGKADR